MSRSMKKLVKSFLLTFKKRGVVSKRIIWVDWRLQIDTLHFFFFGYSPEWVVHWNLLRFVELFWLGAIVYWNLVAVLVFVESLG